ncbi:MAG: 50S ribosomal protein L28 [Magnetococcales bacterium]|nr:50S ribosomal protein L28 [Magnetococcales bacterium]
MGRRATLGGKAPQTGYLVSHSHHETKRQWLPNMQKKALYSLSMGRSLRVELSTDILRTIDRAGGLDDYLMSCDPAALAPNLRRLRGHIAERIAKNAAV